MKKYSSLVTCLLIITILISCGKKESYYEQFTNDKAFTSRVLDLNKTIDEIRAIEKGKLIKDDISLLKYVYEIGKSDTYIVSYLFDEKGCYEIGIDSYFELETDAQNVIDGIKLSMEIPEYETRTEDNNLCRWKNSNESISVELDYKDTARGLFLVTIFANE